MKEKVFFRKGLHKEKENGEIVLVGCRCTECGKAYFPKEPMCNACLSTDFEEIEISKVGTLESYTVVYRPTPGRAFPIPHAAGVVKVPEKVRVYTPIVIPNLENAEKGNEYHCGGKMEMFIDKYYDEGDKEIWGYKFRPIDE